LQGGYIGLRIDGSQNNMVDRCAEELRDLRDRTDNDVLLFVEGQQAERLALRWETILAAVALPVLTVMALSGVPFTALGAAAVVALLFYGKNIGSIAARGLKGPGTFTIAIPKGASATALKKAIKGAPAMSQAKVVECGIDEFNAMISGGNANGIYIDAGILAENDAAALAVILNERSIDASAILISPLPRKKLEDMLHEIMAKLPDIQSMNVIDIFDRLKDAGMLSKVNNELKPLLANNKSSIAGVYNFAAMPTSAELQGKALSVAVTETVALSNIFLAENLTSCDKAGITSYFIYGSYFKTDSEAKAFVTASGYAGNVDNIKFVDNSANLSIQEALANRGAVIDAIWA